MRKLFFALIICIAFWSCSTSPNNNGGTNTTVIPIAPSNLTGVVISSSRVNLSWTDNSTNETGFKIQRRLDGGNYALAGTVNADILNYSDSGLTAYTNYTYRVYSYNAVGNSITYSNEFSISTGGVPVLSTNTVSTISSTTAVSGGNITDIGGSNVTVRGVVWSTNSNPTIALLTKTTDGNGAGVFTSNVTGLTTNTTYYLRAYATNANGTGYGNEQIFITNGTPTITTTAVSSIGTRTAISGGNISNDGGSTIVSRGIVWSTISSPTLAQLTNTVDGSGIGSFTSNIIGLNPNTTYYVRAYATNNNGTYYGNEINFLTMSPTVPVVSTTSVSLLTSTSFRSGGNVSSDGGATIINNGVCWSTNQNPTTSLQTKTINGNNLGTFSSVADGLTPNTTYYLRAYSTNSIGTAYGNQISFVTPNYETTNICGATWFKRNLDIDHYRNGDIIPQVKDFNQWANLTTGAWCYNNNDSSNGPTYGKLYNWYAVNDPRGLAPQGWHIPSKREWDNIIKCLDNNADTTGFSYTISSSIAGGSLKDMNQNLWFTPNVGATNSSGFSALPGGQRNTTADFGGILGYMGLWWTSTSPYSTWSNSFEINHSDANVVRNGYDRKFGLSVRLVKD